MNATAKQIEECDKLLIHARAGRPEVRYARTVQNNAIGAWIESVGRFVMVASYGIDGKWYHVPYEILANGQPPFKPEDWVE